MTDDTKSRPLVLDGFREWWEWRHKGLAIREAMKGDPASVYAGMAAWDAATRAERERAAGVAEREAERAFEDGREAWEEYHDRGSEEGRDRAIRRRHEVQALRAIAAAIRRGPEPTEGV